MFILIAVVCSYTSHAEAILHAQLGLLRAAEAAGISFGEFEHYNAYLSFRRNVQLTSGIKPVYVFTGIFGQYAALALGNGIAHTGNEPDGGKTLAFWGDGDAKWDLTYLRDAARFSIQLITTKESVLAGEGGFFSIHSGEASARELAEVDGSTKGEKVQLRTLGGLSELQERFERARATVDPRQYFMFLTDYIQGANIKGVWKLENPVKVGAPDAVRLCLRGPR
ncbi:hypothetical protein B0H63DRAFT_536193 [Podospora didyma]|uniref:NmrA-like domain-containing protein n=1 Tax=Podospora didyma TaxID=330526 RepID=A0AAE0N267_9PEZI|nr:hypothetical protein B0H63DRAFT_536193 [Podospora didyma]